MVEGETEISMGWGFGKRGLDRGCDEWVGKMRMKL